MPKTTKSPRKTKTSQGESLKAEKLVEIRGEAKVAKINKTPIVIILVFLLAASLVYAFKGLFIAALVNGKPITRLEVIREMEKQDAGKTLDNLITKNLILQELNRQKIDVADVEVEAEVKKIEADLKSKGQDLDKLLVSEQLTRTELKNQIRLQKRIEKMIDKDVSVTDEEVNKYIADNKDSLPTGEKPETLKENIKTQISQQKLNEKFQTLLGSLRQKAKINYFIKY